jgi:tRNA(Ile)-lysidine synthase
MPLLAENGLDSAAIAAAAGRLAAVADAIEVVADRLIEAAVRFDDLAIAWLDPVAYFGGPGEVRRRVLTRLLQAIGGEAYPPRSAKLEALDDAMAKARGRFKRTLAGSVIERRGGGFALYRETGRQGLPEVAAIGAARFVWDHRFEITIGDGVPPDVMVAALGEAGRRAIAAETAPTPADALAALPAFRRGAEILAVPSLSWRKAESGGFAAVARSLVAERSMTPQRFPDVG